MVASEPSAVHPLYKTPGMAHQLEGLRRSKGKRGFMFSCEQGTGKTWIVINEIAQLWGEGGIHGVLVFADNGVHTNWVEIELPKHMPDWVEWKARAWNSAALVAEKRSIDQVLHGDAPHHSRQLRILCVNWEALAHARSMEFIQKFIDSVTKLGIVADESQGIANPDSKRTKQLERIKMQAIYRRAMTGTPILNGPFDLYAQYRFLDPTILQTTSFVAFRREYADMIPAPEPGIPRETDRTAYAIMSSLPRGVPFPAIVASDPITGLPMYKNIERLKRLVEPHTYRVLKEDCLDLPPKTYTQSFFELNPAQRAAYKKMAIEFRYLAGDKDVPVATKLVALMKLQQIPSGYLMTQDGTMTLVPFEDNPKAQLLKARLKQSVLEFKNKCIVWYHHTESVKAIGQACDDLGFRWTAYNGATSKQERTDAIADFQACNLEVIAVQIQTGATGITLTAAGHVLYYENTFSYGDRSQSEDRAHRIGQTKVVLYEDLVGTGTRDMKIVEVLRQKKDLAQMVNGDAGAFLSEEE